LLTCKVGDIIINSFDGTYDKYTLKEWSDRNILKCPVCDRNYEYCHGDFVSPYFRHKEKDCSGYFTEPETDEHKQGKVQLYNWIKNQEGIINCKLEAWIPKTKQRPDIYFEKNGQKFVIEFQCTPISTEYKQRRELYKLNNITDIWVLGKEKYNLEPQFLNNNGVILRRSGRSREKVIEKDRSFSELFYLDYKIKKFIIHSYYLNRFFKRKRYREEYYAFSLDEFVFSNNTISLINDKFLNKINDELIKNQKEVCNDR
jgi:competence CoiA-like predicted nuclease